MADIFSRAPASLAAGPNRLFVDRLIDLLIEIRAACDDTTKALGLTPEDDGLAAVQFLAEEILNVARQERAEQQATRVRKRRSGSHRSTRHLLRDWLYAYSREIELAKERGTDSPKRRREIREGLAQKFIDCGFYGRPRKGANQPAWDFIREKLRAAKRGPRPKSLFLTPPIKS